MTTQTDPLEKLKIKRQALKDQADQLSARIQRAEARARATEKKNQDRIKILAGAMLLEKVREGRSSPAELLADLGQFLQRESERRAVLGEDGRGSETLHRLITPQA